MTRFTDSWRHVQLRAAPRRLILWLWTLAPAISSAAPGLLLLLHLLDLLRVSLLQLLRLLVVLLLPLRGSPLIGLLFRQLPMFSVLRLLECLSIAVLLNYQIFLLLLVSLVKVRV